MSDAGAETGYPGDPAPARLNLTELVIGGAAAATDGYRIFHGRADDVMNPMGYRVSPTEVEDCLARHASVAEWE